MMQKRLKMVVILLALLLCSLGAEGIDFTVNYMRSQPVNISETEICDLVKNSFNLAEQNELYDRSWVYVYANTQNLEFLVVYFFRTDIYEVEIHRLNLDNQGKVSVIYDYDDNELEEQQNEEYCGTCPDETVEIVVSTCQSNGENHPASKNVKKAYDALTAAGIKTVQLYKREESVTAIKDWLSCKNLKLWGRIGHGSKNGNIALSGGSLRPSDIAGMNLTKKMMVLNCCYIHNSKMIPSMIETADAYFFAAGDNKPLGMNSSEPLWEAFLEKSILKDKELNTAMEEAKDENPRERNYGHTCNDKYGPEWFYKNLNSVTIELTSQNNGDEYKVGDKMEITWTSNSQEKVSISLMKGNSVVSPIVENTENDGKYEWVIPDATVPGTNYKIKIAINSIVDESDNSFEIKEKPTALQVNTGNLINTYDFSFHGTAIYYQIPSTQGVSHVQVKIYNLTGKLLGTIVDQKHNPGAYFTPLTVLGDHLTAGAYIGKLTTEGYSKSINIMHH